MEIQKNLKRVGLKVPYNEMLECVDDLFSDKAKRYGWTFTNIEDYEQEQSGYWWAEDEVSRMMIFVAIAYSELKYGNMLTERFKNEMSLDIPVWDSGVVDKFLDEDEKKLIYEHLAIIKKYLKENETSE